MPMGMGGQFGAEPQEMEGLVVWSRASRQAIIDRYYSDKAPFRSQSPSDPGRSSGSSSSRWSRSCGWSTKGLATRRPRRSRRSRCLIWRSGRSMRPTKACATLHKPGSGPRRSGGMMGRGMMGGDMMGGDMMAGRMGGEMPGGPSEAMMTTPDATAPGQVRPTRMRRTPRPAARPRRSMRRCVDGRYIDDQGKPMKDDKSGPFAEFKQMFVYMRFIMDQRRLPNLMAACANVPLPIETRQVRVHVGLRWTSAARAEMGAAWEWGAA